MDSAATRCPHCQTRFRVSEAQLKTARGLVRCGACLEVFNATEHWVGHEPEQRPVETTKAPEPEAATQPDPEPATDRPSVAERKEPTVAEQTPPGEATDDDATTDTSTTAEAPAPDEPAASTEPPDHDTYLDTDHDTAPADADKEDAPAPDSFADLVAHKRRSLAISRRQLAWSALCVLAALTLVGQVVYANFAAIAQSDYRPQLAKTCDVVNFFLRAQYCVLPPAQNLAQIRSRGLNVLSHPDYADSLLVDALIVNTASFAQPFPVIELQFRDRNGRTVAARRFAPEDYLAGELAGETRMPSRQPVRISIGILDPGASAVNYEMIFHPAETGGPYTG